MATIVLFEPEIPQNTGNIIRLAANIGYDLCLIEPLGFGLQEKQLRRAGMDYLGSVNVMVYRSWAHFLCHQRPENLFLLTTKAHLNYWDVSFKEKEALFLLFGPESRGLPASLLTSYPQRCLRIPMVADSRSLNLSNAVAIVAYESVRSGLINS